MKVHFTVVPPGGGEAEYSFFIEMPTPPAAGDYVALTHANGDIASFIVKRTWWSLQSAEDRVTFSGEPKWGTVNQCSVEVYPAEGLGYDSPDHRNLVESYRKRGLTVPSHDKSMY